MADHPIFTESIRRIRALLGETGLDPLQQQVLERLVHSSGDPGLQQLLRFSEGACEQGLAALQAGAAILTDTAMAAAAVTPMAARTLGTSVRCLLDWAPEVSPQDSTRSAVAMLRAWPELTQVASAKGQPMPVLLVGSAPTALEQLLDQLDAGAPAPSLVIGMPVGFVGVPESKRHLAATALAQIRLEGTRGGAGLVAAAANALLRAAQAAS
ncbi:precorrin-8X methylmutase [Synechococcus sp. MIT S9220]|jgi:precorrin-8X/cobalt-precorrin-8 methylmutase|uniref:precorrin-8X methylmutase n=1 Tax=unclassified Synechococcus TaxID=2626047 RepID=UPI00164A361E|nr:precorrin-8X methylmutase [Synechococcus sp. MIT S9220]NOL48138.1 precorrin-8X methylmutase [Synechococcus sp. MIT S9220]QNJ21420.1 precorrin-8X methylmutase [Synechococcus sp. MIT S9220]